MKENKALEIFSNINSEDYTKEEKIEAVKIVMKQPERYKTIWKDEYVRAFQWILQNMNI